MTVRFLEIGTRQLGRQLDKYYFPVQSPIVLRFRFRYEKYGSKHRNVLFVNYSGPAPCLTRCAPLEEASYLLLFRSNCNHSILMNWQKKTITENGVNLGESKMGIPWN